VRVGRLRCEKKKGTLFERKSPFSFAAGIGFFLVGQAGEIVHAGFQRQRNAAALFKAHVALSGFNLGIVTLVYAGQHLHFDLRIPLFHSQLPQSCHSLTPLPELWQIDLLKIG